MFNCWTMDATLAHHPKHYKLLYSLLLLVITRCVTVCRCDNVCTMTSYMASYLDIKYTVLFNPSNADTKPLVYNAQITLKNTGPKNITYADWSIYFSHIRIIEPDTIFGENGAMLGDTQLRVYHINGDLHKISPTPQFSILAPQSSLIVPFVGQYWIIARTDVMPNWYIVNNNNSSCEPLIILSTAGESLSFVSSFDSPTKWKRLVEDDLYNPYTPQTRYDMDYVQDLGGKEADGLPGPSRAIIPTPLQMSINWSRRVNVKIGGWVVVAGDNNVTLEAKFLADGLGIAMTSQSDASLRRIDLLLGEVKAGSEASSSLLGSNEAYRLDVDTVAQTVTILGRTSAGVFYGVQTLISLANDIGDVPHGYILDAPRFEYRGMHLDVSRNFHDVNDVMRLCDVMSQYKMNKLHLHLADDEGWRLEIPGIPELTDVGSRRCHDLNETRCILPQLGSGPSLSPQATGYYTKQDYIDILKYSATRHIQVIPEIDMPGHAHAAIKSMEARYWSKNSTNQSAAEEFLLSDLFDQSDYLSVQAFTDNAINPCINSTYHFIRTVLGQINEFHTLAGQPLTWYHFGGDEAPAAAGNGSSLCLPLLNDGVNLKRYFIERLVEIASSTPGLKGLVLWEDGLYEHYNDTIVKRIVRGELLPGGAEEAMGGGLEIYADVWNNVWDEGTAGRAYELANDGYQEPDSDERGFYWATRQTSAKKTFSYTPDNVYYNIDLDLDRMGNVLSREVFCKDDGACPPLDADKRKNIIGIQGQLWSETTRTSAQLDSMICPRLLALAERAWHKAEWEDKENVEERRKGRDQDWENFANTLGYKELKRLDRIRVKYRVPPPGARVDAGTGVVQYTSGLPGLPISYSYAQTTASDTESSSSNTDPVWTPLTASTLLKLANGQTVYLRTGSADGSRFSRVVALTANSSSLSSNFSFLFILILLLLLHSLLPNTDFVVTITTN